MAIGIVLVGATVAFLTTRGSDDSQQPNPKPLGDSQRLADSITISGEPSLEITVNSFGRCRVLQEELSDKTSYVVARSEYKTLTMDEVKSAFTKYRGKDVNSIPAPFAKSDNIEETSRVLAIFFVVDYLNNVAKFVGLIRPTADQIINSLLENQACRLSLTATKVATDDNYQFDACNDVFPTNLNKYVKLVGGSTGIVYSPNRINPYIDMDGSYCLDLSESRPVKIGEEFSLSIPFIISVDEDLGDLSVRFDNQPEPIIVDL